MTLDRFSRTSRLLVLASTALASAAAAGDWSPPKFDLRSPRGADSAFEIKTKEVPVSQALERGFSARVVVPELTWSWWVSDPRPIAGYLALELRTGGVLGRGEIATDSPLIMVGRGAYGAGGGILRIGIDGTLYLAFKTDPDTELYCCLGESEPRRERGLWGHVPAELADIGREGFYPVGRLHGVAPEQLRHGASLKRDQVRFSPGLRPSSSRRIQRGDRIITLESDAPPVFATEAAPPASDPAAVADALRAAGRGLR